MSLDSRRYLTSAFMIAIVLLPRIAVADVHQSSLLFDSDMETPLADLLNQQNASVVERGRKTVLEMPSVIAPDRPAEWQFRFNEPFLKDWERLVLEVEYFDDGAGVIQPKLLAKDAFAGEWSTPVRAASFTRLNTRRYRKALFQFDVPKVDWASTRNPHLTISGLRYLSSLRAHVELPEKRWVAIAKSVPQRVTPLVRLQRPMQITCTVGIPDIGNPPSIDNALDNIREYAPLATLLGFTSVECFVRWDLIEPRPGEFDFSHYDRIVEAIRDRDLKWYPNLVITSAFALPSWYFTSESNVGFQCLEHRLNNQVPSIWNSANREHVARVLKAFGDHYGPMNVLEAVRLGPSGNFGEAQYPAGAGQALGYHGEKMHAHIGWWAGDAFARADFQRHVAARYTSIDSLNRAWQENFSSFESVGPELPETYRTRDGRYFMTAWYTDSMTRWCNFWSEQATRALPKTPIYQSAGGWGYREAGTDFSALAASMRHHGGGIRLTNETDSFEQNVYATRLAATAARLYGIPLGYEPAGYHSARGTVARFYSTITTNADNLYTRHTVLFTDPLSVENWLRDYPLLDQRAAPIIDVAVYYPETMNQLDDGAFRHLYGWGFNPRAAEIRRRVDVDYLDERLIRSGFLERYRVLVFCWGNVIDSETQRHIDTWLRAGGTIVYPSYPRGPQETIDGDTTAFLAWERGDTGKGVFLRFQGDMEPLTLYGDFVEEALKEHATGLHPWTRQVLGIQHPHRVFISVLENGTLAVLNYSKETATVQLEGRFHETLSPFSVRLLRLE